MGFRHCFVLVLRIFILLSIVTIYESSTAQNKSGPKNFENITIMAATTTPTRQLLYACNFEVFGRVQGVFFRKYTQKQANVLGVRGWCMNTSEGTVKGQLEAPLAQINEMKHWLQNKGSPKSNILKAEFSTSKEIDAYTFGAFTIRR